MQGDSDSVDIQQSAPLRNRKDAFAQRAHHLVTDAGHGLAIEIGLAERLNHSAAMACAVAQPNDFLHRKLSNSSENELLDLPSSQSPQGGAQQQGQEQGDADQT